MSAAVAKAGARNLAPVVDDPDFKDSSFESIGAPDIDGWFKPVLGAKFKGQVVGRIQIENDDGKLRDVCLVRLEIPCEGCVVDGEEGKVLETGKVLGVGIRAKLADMLFYVEKKGRVLAKVTGEQKLRGNRTMWIFDLKGEKGKRSATVPAATPRMASDDTGL
jgi:hypothetical protein